MQSSTSVNSSTSSFNYLNINDEISESFLINPTNTLRKVHSSSTTIISVYEENLNFKNPPDDEKKLLKLDEFIDLVKNEYRKTKNLDILLDNEDFKKNYLLACSKSKLDFLKKRSKIKIGLNETRKRKENEKIGKIPSTLNKTSLNKKAGIVINKTAKKIDKNVAKTPPSKILKPVESNKNEQNIKKNESRPLAERLKSVYLNSSNTLKKIKNPNLNNNSKKLSKDKNQINPNNVKKSNKKSSLNVKGVQQDKNKPNKLVEKKLFPKSSNNSRKLSKNETSLKKPKINSIQDQVSKSLLSYVIDESVSEKTLVVEDSKKESDKQLNEKQNSDLNFIETIKSEKVLEAFNSNETIKPTEENKVLKNESHKSLKIENDKSSALKLPKCEEYKLENIQSAVSTAFEMTNFQTFNKNTLIHDYFADIPHEHTNIFDPNEYNDDIISDANSSSYETFPQQTTNLNSLESKMNLEQLEKDIEQRKQCEGAVNDALQNIFVFHKTVLNDYFKANENEKNPKLFDEVNDENWKVFICLPSLYDKHGKTLISLFKRNTDCKFFLYYYQKIKKLTY
jgi:hypothetical protein